MRDLDSGLLTEFLGGTLRPVIFVEMEFVSGFLRVWSGLNTYSWDGKSWTGVGDMGSVGQIEETGDLRSPGLLLSLSGIQSSILGTVIGDLRQGKTCNVWFGALDTSGALVGDPYGVFIGKMDTASVEDGPETAQVQVGAENRLVEVERPRLRRFTHEDQKIDYPTDNGFNNTNRAWRGIKFPVGAGHTRP